MKINHQITPYEKARRRKAEMEEFLKQFEPKEIATYDDHGNVVHVYESRWAQGAR